MLIPVPKVKILALQFSAYSRSPVDTSPTSVFMRLSFTLVSASIVGLSFYSCIKMVSYIPLSPNFMMKFKVSGLSPVFFKYSYTYFL